MPQKSAAHREDERGRQHDESNATTSQGMGGKQDERRHQIGGGGASRGGVCSLRGQEVEVA